MPQTHRVPEQRQCALAFTATALPAWVAMRANPADVIGARDQRNPAEACGVRASHGIREGRRALG